jgi:hypothetical protein
VLNKHVKRHTTKSNITAITLIFSCCPNKYPVRLSVTMPHILSYPPVKVTPCTKLYLTVNCYGLLVWALLGTQVQDQGKKYCLSLLVQESLSQRSEMWNDNINIQLHNKSLSNAKLCDVWNSEAYVKKHRARRPKCALEFGPLLRNSNWYHWFLTFHKHRDKTG